MPVIYTAEHPALAALEILNAWQQYSDLTGYSLYLCRLDPDAIINAAPELKALSVDVRDLRATRAFGDDWMASRRSVALRVPSVVAPASYNYLLNPDHPGFDASVAAEALGPFQYDERIIELVRAAKEARAEQ